MKVKQDLIFFSKGKRSLVYLDPEKKIIYKFAEKKVIKKEWLFLNILKKYSFVPNPLEITDEYIAMEYIDGKNLKELIKENNPNLPFILKMSLKYCEILDNLKINKLEMNRPYKHIIFREKDKKVFFIDFERAKFTLRPKNKNQFIQFLRKIGQWTN